ncbi:hypothetical protein BSKO_01296 [Bryopsis sp. KO-2023]|nr:hypothetical protein BSKO_01296 [Bryopsis sp. KO-2023]
MPESSFSDGLAQFGWASIATLASPFRIAQEVFKRITGQESNQTLCEKLGLPSVERPAGKLLWFCAQSVAEVAVLLPVVHRCLLERREINILLTTRTAEAYALFSNVLPSRVILQYYPLDAPIHLALMVGYWKPSVVIFVESDLSPNLVECLSGSKCRLVLLNAHLSSENFLEWHSNPCINRRIMSRMLSRFHLIVPQSEVDVGRFRMLGATIQQMPGWCSDLKYAASMGACVWEMWRPSGPRVLELKRGVAGRPLWLAVSTHEGEEACVAGVHRSLANEFRNPLTIVVPRHPSRCPEVMAMFKERGLIVHMWSKDLKSYSNVDIFLVDDVGELPLLYAVSEIAFVGGSLLEGQEGHNLAEPAVSGCAVIVGKHAGQFNRMADELNEAAILAAEEAAEAVNSSGFGNVHDEYGADDVRNDSQAGPSGEVLPSPMASPSDSYFFQREDSNTCLRSDPSESRLARPATAPAAVAYQWEFEPWPQLQGRPGDPGWLGNERSTSRQSSQGGATIQGSSSVTGARMASEPPMEDTELALQQERSVSVGRVDRGNSGLGMSRPGRLYGGANDVSPIEGPSQSPSQSPGVPVDITSPDPGMVSPMQRSEASMNKDSLGVVPESMIGNPLEVENLAPEREGEAPSLADLHHGGDDARFIFSRESSVASLDQVGQTSDRPGAVVTPNYGNSPLFYGDTPRSMGPTVDGGLWRGSSSAVSPLRQASGMTPSSPSQGRRMTAPGEFDSSFRFAGQYILPATHLPYSPHGPAVWRVTSEEDLAYAVSTLLKEPLERRSRGHAAAQGAAKLATGLVSTVWSVMEDMVLEPALGSQTQCS